MTDESALTDPGRIVLGLGGTVDYEVDWSGEVIGKMIQEFGLRASDLPPAADHLPEVVQDERELLLTLLTFVRDGAGGERFVSSAEVLESVASRFDTRVTLGGTCVRGAIGLQALGIGSTTHLVSVDDHVRRLWPPGAAYICSASQDSTDPHLIFQWGAMATAGHGDLEVVAPHPSRVIFAHDPPNAALVIDEGLGDLLATADVFMVSGFNSITDPELLSSRLADVQRHCRRLPDRAVVVFEDAAYHSPGFGLQAGRAMSSVVDVHSMNEDELQTYLRRRVDLLDPRDVDVALGQVSDLFGAPTFVIHTKYWSLAYGDEPWRYEAALRGGITLASTRYRIGDGITEADFEETRRMTAQAAGRAFAEAIGTATWGRGVCDPSTRPRCGAADDHRTRRHLRRWIRRGVGRTRHRPPGGAGLMPGLISTTRQPSSRPLLRRWAGHLLLPR